MNLIVNPEKLKNLDQALLKKVLSLVTYLNTKVIIAYSNDGSHTKNSFHYQNLAVDLVFPEYKGSLFSLYLIVERFGFIGIGLYPKLKFEGKNFSSIHLDMRILGEEEQRPRWIAIPEFREDVGKIRNAYYPLNPQNLVKFKILTKVEI